MTKHDRDAKQWNNSIQSPERELEMYRQAMAAGATAEELSAAAERLAAAVRSMQSTSHSKSTDGPPSYRPAASCSSNGARSPDAPHKQPELDEQSDSSSSKSQPELSDAPPKQPKFDERSDSSSYKSQHPLKQAGRGFLMVVAAPLAVAGAGLYAAGKILEGGSMMLKGMGAVGKMPLEKVIVQGKKSPPK